MDSGKVSSRSNKSGSSKIAAVQNVVDAKQKKPKKKKKGRRNSDKPDSPSTKLYSDDERGRLQVEGVKTGDPQQPESEDSTGATGLMRLPSLSKIKSSPPPHSQQSPTNGDSSSSSKLQHASNIYKPDPAAVNTLAQKLNSLNLRQKPSSKTSSKNRLGNAATKLNKQSSKQTKDKSISKSAPATAKQAPSGSNTRSGAPTASSAHLASNESLRWDNALDDSEEERERIRIYKMNRRKRYLAAAQSKGLSWALNYTVTNSFQLNNNDDTVKFDVIKGATAGVGASSYATVDFSPMRSLRGSQQGLMATAMVEC